MPLANKHTALQEFIKPLNALVVAFSGGIDSALVLKVAHDVLGETVLAVTADSPALPRNELAEATRLAGLIGVRHLVITTAEMQNENYLKNSADRCYFCKSELYSTLRDVARQERIRFIANGTNLDDLSDYRPGLRAADEFAVVSPLKEARLTKIEVRNLARKLGLDIWSKPASPCLSSRIPYGSPVTRQKLQMIEKAEDTLKAFGIKELRVRHFDGGRARIEVAREDLGFVKSKYDQILRRLRAIGFETIAIAEFKSGSLNLALESNVQTAA